MNEEEQGVAPLEKIKKYIERLGASKKESTSGRGHVFFNGRYLPLDGVSPSQIPVSFVYIGDVLTFDAQDFLRALQAESGQQMQWLQEKVRVSSACPFSADN